MAKGKCGSLLVESVVSQRVQSVIDQGEMSVVGMLVQSVVGQGEVRVVGLEVAGIGGQVAFFFFDWTICLGKLLSFFPGLCVLVSYLLAIVLPSIVILGPHSSLSFL